MSIVAPVGSSDSPSLLDLLLVDQNSVAVDTFAKWHDSDPRPANEKHYRDLIPSSVPNSGDQYAFEVDLDACSGCKSCVAACHSLNGLEDEEIWRSVGLLQGGNSHAAVIQHVTTACHH